MKDTFIDEINQDYRRDQLQRFWKSFGSYIVSISVGIILLTVGIVVWQNHRESTRQEWSAKFLTAHDLLEAGSTKDAVAVLKEIQEKGASDQRLLAAILLLQTSPKDVHHSFKAENPYSDYARAYAYAVQDTPDKKSSNDYRLIRDEADALSLYAKGDVAAAIKKLEALGTDAEAPSSLRERMAVLIPYLRENGPANAAAGETTTEPEEAKPQ